jgi:recombination endonuclease VII
MKQWAVIYRQTNPEKVKQATLAWRNANPDKVKAQKRRHWSKHVEYNMNRRLVKNYGITLQELRDRAEKQGHKCAICGTSEPGGTGTWSVDHDHKTAKNRDLLCNSCNLGLGKFKDDANLLRRAAAYLDKHSVPGSTTEEYPYSPIDL